MFVLFRVLYWKCTLYIDKGTLAVDDHKKWDITLQYVQDYKTYYPLLFMYVLYMRQVIHFQAINLGNEWYMTIAIVLILCMNLLCQQLNVHFIVYVCTIH